ncbi:MAG: hypothetical protein DBY41_08455 [Clostridium sp.]|nr:MAG: hypothetical protein DBY41_08455 [Clostridium sp.]
MIKICEYCGKKYETTRSWQKFCSNDCRDDGLNERAYKKRNINTNVNKEIYKNSETKKLIHKLCLMLKPYRTIK